MYKRQPLAYILNSSKFYDKEFYVDERVLIPRPETELLVDFIIEQDFSKIKILDAGTGSGCIGISLALENPTLELYGSDFSMDSLNVAKINKNNLKADNFHLIHADWLSCFKEKSFDLIVIFYCYFVNRVVQYPLVRLGFFCISDRFIPV